MQKSWIFVDVRAEALDEPDAYYGGVCNQREREKRSRVDDWRCRQKIGGGEGKKKD